MMHHQVIMVPMQKRVPLLMAAALTPLEMLVLVVILILTWVLGTLPTETDHAEIIDDSGQGNQQSGDTANLTEPADDASADASAGALEEGKAEDEHKDEHEHVSDSDGNPVPTSDVAIPEVEAQADEASEVVVQQHDDQPSTLEEGNNTQQQQATAAAAAIDLN